MTTLVLTTGPTCLVLPRLPITLLLPPPQHDTYQSASPSCAKRLLMTHLSSPLENVNHLLPSQSREPQVGVIRLLLVLPCLTMVILPLLSPALPAFAPRDKYVKLAFSGNPSTEVKLRWLSIVTKTFHLQRDAAEVKMAALTSRFIYVSRQRTDILDRITTGEFLSLPPLPQDSPERPQFMIGDCIIPLSSQYCYLGAPVRISEALPPASAPSRNL
ncbi:uncharacterized protein LOC143035533 [Oratosquilla oratoria]|uniref:uncharacterized protein LOC143035533 n=1 Tax=Oratosquilla oratoria TaxID=337810 RepID=UPI003F76B5DF